MKTFVKNGKTYAKRTDLTPWEKNPRDIKPEKLQQLVDDIKRAEEFAEDGQIKPVLINNIGTVIGGNMRMRAFEMLGTEDIWVSIIDTDNPKIAFEWAMRDNMAYGYYEEDKLAEVAQELDIDSDLLEMLTIETGDLKTIAQVLEDIPEDPQVDEDEEPEPEEKFTSARGKIYQLGEHRIMCGDSTSKDDVARLMGGKKATMIFTDPPYNVNYSGAGKKTSNTIKNDHMDGDQFRDFLNGVFDAMRSGAKKNAPAYVCYASREHRAFEDGLEHAGYEVRAQIIWVKPLASWGFAQYRWKHEPILYAVVEGEPVDFYGDRKQYTHWEFKPTDEELLNEARAMLTEAEEDDTTIWKFERDTNYEHPTSKPVKLPAKAILNSSKPGEIVLDLFAGGGSTLMAADATGRICYTMELDERYVDVVRKRYAKSIGREEDWEEATPEVQA